jgi:hypothetical protein
MKKISDNFCGYLKVGDDKCAYSVSNNIVTLLPAQNEETEIDEAFERLRSRKTELPEYLLGEDYDGLIAIIRNDKFSTRSLGFTPSIKFATPIIIKAEGNGEGFFRNLTEEWDRFHAIMFIGGNINAVCNPQLAVEKSNYDGYLENDGAREIKIRPWNDYTYSTEFEMDGEKIALTISVAQTGEDVNAEHHGAYSLGELNSFIRLTFEKAKSFNDVEKYYSIIKDLIAILTLQNNVSFETDIRQKNSENELFRTGVCRIFDHYENYSVRKCQNVISIYSISDYVPNLINAIMNNEADSLLEILPEDNGMIGKVTITNIQDLCTALEVACKWGKRNREKDNLIENLKKEIKKTIATFIESHDDMNACNETTINSAFDYLDYTLKQKILTLYNENRCIIDAIIAKRSLPQISEASVAAFVNFRNNKTHSGTVEWGDSARIYTALLALGYACLFRYVDIPDKVIESVLIRIF